VGKPVIAGPLAETGGKDHGNTFLDISTTAAASFGAEHAFKFVVAPDEKSQPRPTGENPGVQRLLISARHL